MGYKTMDIFGRESAVIVSNVSSRLARVRRVDMAQVEALKAMDRWP